MMIARHARELCMYAAAAAIALALTGCATSEVNTDAAPVASSSHQLLLVSLSPADFLAFFSEARELSAIPGVQRVRIGRSVDLGANPPSWWVADYDFALEIEFANEDATVSYSEHPIYRRWVTKWEPRFTHLRALRYVVQ